MLLPITTLLVGPGVAWASVLRQDAAGMDHHEPPLSKEVLSPLTESLPVALGLGQADGLSNHPPADKLAHLEN